MTVPLSFYTQHEKRPRETRDVHLNPSKQAGLWSTALATNNLLLTYVDLVLQTSVLPPIEPLLGLRIPMAATFRTSEFRQILNEKEAGLPEAKRRKLSRAPKRSDSHSESDALLSKEYIAEAYVVVRMVATPAEYPNILTNVVF